MAVKDTAATITFYAYDVSADSFKTGDSGNFTLRGNSDGVAFTPANSPAEVDATNHPGAYDLLLALGENDGRHMTVGGKSSTANIIIIPCTWMNETDADDVNALSAGVVTAAAIATDAVDADALAADAVAEINATVDTALADIHLDHLLGVAESDTAVDDSVIAKLAATGGDWSTFAATTDSLQSIRDALAAGTVAYTGPVAIGGDATVIKGDDYDADESRALDWATTSSATWPDLDSGDDVITTTIEQDDGSGTAFTGSIVTSTGATKKVRQELTAAETAALDVGTWRITVVATLVGASNRTVTLVDAMCLVKPAAS